MVGDYPIEAIGDRLRVLTGLFTVDGSGQAVASTQFASGFTLSRVSAGLYRATFARGAKCKAKSIAFAKAEVLFGNVTPAGRATTGHLHAASVTSDSGTVDFLFEIPATGGAAGTAADLPNSSQIMVMIVLNRGRI